MPPDAVDPQLRSVRIDPGPDLAAAVPHLLGFTPQESLVLVALTGELTRRVGVTLRVDLPPPGLEGVLAAQAVRSLAEIGPSAVVVVLVTEAPDDVLPAVGPWGAADDDLAEAPAAGKPVLPGRGLLTEVVLQLSEAGIAVADSLLVRSGRCWSYVCDGSCCAPGAGRPLPGGTSPLAAASAFSGQVLAASRDELVDRLRPVRDGEAREMGAACSRVGAELAALLDAQGWEHVADGSWQHVLEAVDRCVPGTVARLSDDDVARVGFALVDPALRDRALLLVLDPDAAAEALWTQLVRRLPPPLDATPATLLAVAAWSRGDGATATTALGRALSSRPDHPLAQLLRSALDAALPPAQLRRLVTEAVAGPRQPETVPSGFRAARGAPSQRRGRARRGTR